MRIDKFLWCVRLFKTRSLASKNVDTHKVKINGITSKSSKNIIIGDEIAIKKLPIWRLYKVIGIPKSRVNAKTTHNFITETTVPSQLKELEMFYAHEQKNQQSGFKGRPTKKDRRNIDKLK